MAELLKQRTTDDAVYRLMTTSAKTEALAALQYGLAALGGAEPIEGLRRHQLRASLEYALEQIEAIQELKRRRRAAAGPEAP